MNNGQIPFYFQCYKYILSIRQIIHTEHCRLLLSAETHIYTFILISCHGYRWRHDNFIKYNSSQQLEESLEEFLAI